MFSMASGQAGRNQDAAVVKFVTGNSSRLNAVQPPLKCNLLNLREIKCIPKR
jgi:hypothetical protein